MITPLVSIIVPAYNAERYLKNCIDSILRQTVTDFEVIIVNDGSKDATPQICDEIAKDDNRVRVFHQANGGVSSARNVGLDNAIGDWICFVDSDDSVDKYWLEKFTEHFLDADMICQGAILLIDGVKEYIRLKDCYAKGAERHEVLAYLASSRGSILNSLWCKCYKKSAIDKSKLRFLENCQMGEDLIFTIQYLLLTNSVKVLSYCGYYYQRDNSTLTKLKHNPTALLGWKKILFSKIDLLCNENRNNILFKSIAQNEFSYLAFCIIGNFKNVEKGVRIDFYNFLGEIRNYVSIGTMPFNRVIYYFDFLPLSIFDVLMRQYSSIYLGLRKLAQKKLYVR